MPARERFPPTIFEALETFIAGEEGHYADSCGCAVAVIGTRATVDVECITPLIERALARGLGVYAYTFGTDRARQRRFVERGVSGLFTNNPDITRGAVAPGGGAAADSGVGVAGD